MPVPLFPSIILISKIQYIIIYRQSVAPPDDFDFDAIAWNRLQTAMAAISIDQDRFSYSRESTLHTSYAAPPAAFRGRQILAPKATRRIKTAAFSLDHFACIALTSCVPFFPALINNTGGTRAPARRAFASRHATIDS